MNSLPDQIVKHFILSGLFDATHCEIALNLRLIHAVNSDPREVTSDNK